MKGEGTEDMLKVQHWPHGYREVISVEKYVIIQTWLNKITRSLRTMKLRKKGGNEKNGMFLEYSKGQKITA